MFIYKYTNIINSRSIHVLYIICTMFYLHGLIVAGFDDAHGPVLARICAHGQALAALARQAAHPVPLAHSTCRRWVMLQTSGQSILTQNHHYVAHDGGIVIRGSTSASSREPRRVSSTSASEIPSSTYAYKSQIIT
jgi:hypothetical protein